LDSLNSMRQRSSIDIFTQSVGARDKVRVKPLQILPSMAL
jgi:hypothetical protein